MVARGTQIVRSIAHSERSFGGDQHFVAAPFHCFSKNFFRDASRIHVRRVEQIHAGFETNVHEPGGFGYVAISPRAEKLIPAAERTGAEAQDRHFQPRISQLSVFHNL